MYPIAFCGNCRNLKFYREKKTKMTQTVKQHEVRYTATLAFCKKCDEEMYIPRLHDMNIERMRTAYEKAKPQ